MSNTETTQKAQVHQVNSKSRLNEAIQASNRGDTIVLTTDGNYGDIRLTNKSGIRIKASNKGLLIEASITIDGNSSHIIIENINLWNAEQNKHQLIIIGNQASQIIIRHCIISTLPVSMNKLREKYEGNPNKWLNGINILGSTCNVINNIFVNIKTAILASGADTLIQSNLIQYFSKDAIHVKNHGVLVLQNRVYDSVNSRDETRGKSNACKKAILLTPPKDKQKGGELKKVEIIGNTIRSHSRNTTVAKDKQSILQGIVGRDGYFTNLTIAENSLVLNSDHGITLNGAYKLILFNNKTIKSPQKNNSTPGINLYLTRISTSHSDDPKWLANKKYSVRYESNQAPTFNLPDEFYKGNDTGNNHFSIITHDLVQGKDAVVIRSNKALSTTTPPPLPIPTHMPPRLSAAPAPKLAARESTGQIHQVKSAVALAQAIQQAAPQDTIIITHPGHYGQVRITNKSQLRIQSLNTDIPIEASFFIDGTSHNIVLENMQIWNSDLRHKQLIITGPTTTSVSIRNCVLSTVRVNRNTMRNHYSGNPRKWINGIRMLGSNGQIINNNLINLNLSISQTGLNTLVKHNLVQFYAEDAIRVSHHGVRVYHNSIYDSVSTHPGQSAHKDAIQLIPPQNVLNGGSLNNVAIVGNVIQSNTPFSVPDNERGTVQGIFGSDGYFVNLIITGNTIAVNSDHGISLNGVKNARINNNRILDLTPSDHFNPGIKLYLTRISQNGQQSWLANRSYSVQLSSNQAPILNIPSEAYTVYDSDNNRFATFSHNLARGPNPILIRSNHVSTDPIIIDLPDNEEDPDTAGQVYSISNKSELDRAIKLATAGDTLLIKKAGSYGTIRLSNKKDIRLKASNPNLAINAHLLIDGHSKNILIENLTLWFSENNWKPVILTAPSTQNITIRNCLISSTPVTRGAASDGISGNPAQWVSGLWLRGTSNNIIDNRIVNVSVGINASGLNTLIQNNLIQYYTEVGVRVFNHNIEVLHNNIYDAIIKQAGSRRRNTGIQMIPPKDRFSAGELRNIKLTDNVIQTKNAGTNVPHSMRGRLQGITGQDGYMKNITISDNTIIINTEHGIVLNGVSQLIMNNNKVFDSSPRDNVIPGIRLYYTRTIDIKGNRQQVWHTALHYSVSYSNNRAPVFNIPESKYQENDAGGNDFDKVTENSARGVNPILKP